MALANSIWYFSLVFIGLIIFMFTYWNSNHFRKDLAVYFFAAGLSFIGEFVVLILLNSYHYYPHVFKEKWTDDIFGSLISQGVIIPIVLMAIAAFRLKTKWVILIISLIAFIEELFLRLHIYEHNWWKTWYTIVLLLLAAYIMKWWRRKLNDPSTLIKFLTIYMLFTIILHTKTFLLLTVFKLSWYSVGLFESVYKDHTILKIIIDITMAIPLTAIVLFSYKYLTLIGLLVFLIIFDFVQIKMGFLHVVDYNVVIGIAFIKLFTVFIVKRTKDYLFPMEKDYI
ncbi:hypothetical protein [Bacillus sp. FJAT-29937]|uniref:hypothetical protein n=1 Tax=Bacillus sp. FJAT-29937 TaxID=1720553 RepID=UPI000AEB6D1B|nr:hypothetical protein [Bacillus sp. FJAT-29937]